jgi:urease subunit beta
MDKMDKMYTSNKVTIYEGADFKKPKKELDEGEYNIYDLGIGNNKLSSLTVPAGMKVTLYEYEDFRGRSKTFTNNVDNLKNIEVGGKNFDNETSSIKVERIAMTPGQIVITNPEPIQLNAKREKDTIKLTVENHGDRPIQVGSHFHFYEVNDCLKFEREKTKGMHLNITAGTARRFEPGVKCEKVELVPFGGTREIYGFNGKVNGKVDNK